MTTTTTLYKIPVYPESAKEHMMEFEYLNSKGPVPPGMPARFRIHWNSFYANQHPIKIHSINGTKVEDTFGFVNSMKMAHEGTILTRVVLYMDNGELKVYEPDRYMEFWLNDESIPRYLEDGAIKVCAKITDKEQECFYLRLSDFVDVLDGNGNFRIVCHVNARVKDNYGEALELCEMTATLILEKGKYKTIVINDTNESYPIWYTVGFHKLITNA
jgi:hypothetical protein